MTSFRTVTVGLELFIFTIWTFIVLCQSVEQYSNMVEFQNSTNTFNYISQLLNFKNFCLTIPLQHCIVQYRRRYPIKIQCDLLRS